MSSDGSVSSRLSQFGLYRTIDARTEDFLNLSKKRQIRQGCVCAAISTALTVIVVVVVILVYEYNVVKEARKTNSKPNWFVNSSVDFPVLEENYNDANIKIDGITIKILPILLKALKQIRYIENIMEDATSLRPTYDISDTTDVTYTKNIFADTRNWMKIPDSRLYTIEYKTSPILYYKNPTRNVEYFTKIRKIRDYQRILNYVDKMISEKNSIGSTQPMNSFSHTDNPLQSTPTTTKRNLVKKNKKPHTKSTKTSTQEKKSNCGCPHKPTELMKKLFAGIQQLLTYFSRSPSNNTHVVHDCYDPIKTKDGRSEKSIYTTTTINNNDVIEPEITEPTVYKTFLNKHKYTVDLMPINHDIRREHTLNTIINFIKPNNNKQIYYDENFESRETNSEIRNYFGPSTNFDIIKETSTEIIPIYTSNTKAPSDAVTTVADYILQKGTYDISAEIKSFFKILSDNDYSDTVDYTKTNANRSDNLSKLDARSTELIKTKIIPEDKNNTQDIPFDTDETEKNSTTYQFKGMKPNNKIYDNITGMRKLGKLVAENNSSNYLPMLYRYTAILNTTVAKTTEATTVAKYNVTSLPLTTEKAISIAKNENISYKQNTTITKHQENKHKNTDSIILKREFLAKLKGTASTETTLKQIEEAIKILNKETTPKQADKFVLPDNTYQWESVKLDEHTTSIKSIIPEHRSTYLEMQRNDYPAKRDENQDYDNYILD